ncbi:hypothetical protein HPB49_003318 [Dermacentor silvarum]|uniref:Uncharacterized protein n=1 Tax=Dermacentor silvarum TaxID=543639 RepID=A0ACB8CV25_DERSI|nr:hypothetical protein HPB49_003318 [Dermacentor silvarum]
MEKFKDKKSMWAAIAGELSSETGLERTAMQCENRFKTAKKKHNNARKHNRQSGVSPVDVPYAEQMDKLAAVDYTLYPEVLRGVGRVERNTARRPQLTTLRVLPQQRRGATSHALLQSGRRSRNRWVMWKIHKDREEARERRHQEKLALIRELFTQKD